MSDRHTRELRDGASMEAVMTAAYRDGEDTALAGEERVNPWNGGPDVEPRERVLSRMWAHGYSAGNPMPPIPDEDAEPADDGELLGMLDARAQPDQ